jgi:tetratricopeptide (TPR) repeat protein
MKTTPFLVLVLSIIFSFEHVSACSMFKITEGGKTIVGNNEDYWNPNTRIWFEQGEDSKFGAMYVGFDNLYPQGGMNEAGLVFDGFAMDYLEVADTTGKKSIITEDEIFFFTKNILQTCSNVTEVKEVLLQYNLERFHSSLLFFVDKSGDYLVMEGDSLILGNDPTYIQSNFYPSCTKDEKDVKIDFYQKGRDYLNQNTANTSLAYCTNMMNAMHQDWGYGGTLYSTVYDLETGVIYLYYHSDFDTVVTFDLKKELEKGNQSLKIPELFPENTDAQKQLAQYNTTNEQIELLDNPNLANDNIELQRLIDQVISTKPDFRFESQINMVGYKWTGEHKNLATAIRIFRLNCKLFPKSSNAFDSLGEAYMENQQYTEALKQYKKSLKLNKRNANAEVQIVKLKKLIK